MPTKFNTKTLWTFFFFSHQTSFKTLQLINKPWAWNVINHTYQWLHILLGTLALVEKTFGSLEIWLFRQFCVQKFSADTKKLHELALQRGKLGIHGSVLYIEWNSKRASALKMYYKSFEWFLLEPWNIGSRILRTIMLYKFYCPLLFTSGYFSLFVSICFDFTVQVKSIWLISGMTDFAPS